MTVSLHYILFTAPCVPVLVLPCPPSGVCMYYVHTYACGVCVCVCVYVCMCVCVCVCVCV